MFASMSSACPEAQAFGRTSEVRDIRLTILYRDVAQREAGRDRGFGIIVLIIIHYNDMIECHV